jgi:hypothetical protein
MEQTIHTKGRSTMKDEMEVAISVLAHQGGGGKEGTGW